MSELKKLLEGVKVEWKALGDVFDIIAGGDVPKDSFSNIKTDKYQFPILSNGIDEKSLYGWTAFPKISNPSLTISARGTIGWTSIQYKPFFPIVRLLVLTPKIDMHIKYAYHYMKSIEKKYIVSKAGIPQLTKPMIKDTHIPIPCPENPEKSLQIQEEIVRILDALTKKTNALTNELHNELKSRQKQYEYQREQLFKFEGKEVEWKSLGESLCRTKGTKITAEQMKVLNKADAPIKIFAGGKTIAFFDFNDLPKKDINYEPSIIVKSRGIIEFEFYDKPFSHKNEMWSYYSKNKYLNIKYVYYFLKTNEFYFQNLGKKMQMPQISIPNTGKFKIPIPFPNDSKKSLEEQERIVKILNELDTATQAIAAGIKKEIALRNKQYAYYRDLLLSFPKEEA